MTAASWQGSGTAPSGESSQGDQGQFDVALRGYDRRQVDERMAHLSAALAAAEEALHDAEQRNAELDAQLRLALDRLRQAGGSGAQANSFGFRVEKILRLAEEEAKELRAQGAAEAASLVEKARTDAKAIRDDAARVLAAAQRDAAQASAQARASADELAARVNADVARQRAAAEQELRRLTGLQDRVRADLHQLWNVLRSAVAERAPDAPGPDAPGPDAPESDAPRPNTSAQDTSRQPGGAGAG